MSASEASMKGFSARMLSEKHGTYWTSAVI